MIENLFFKDDDTLRNGHQYRLSPFDSNAVHNGDLNGHKDDGHSSLNSSNANANELNSLWIESRTVSCKMIFF